MSTGKHKLIGRKLKHIAKWIMWKWMNSSCCWKDLCNIHTFLQSYRIHFAICSSILPINGVKLVIFLHGQCYPPITSIVGLSACLAKSVAFQNAGSKQVGCSTIVCTYHVSLHPKSNRSVTVLMEFLTLQKAKKVHQSSQITQSTI